MRLRTVRAPGGGCRPRWRWILSGGDCVSEAGGGGRPHGRSIWSAAGWRSAAEPICGGKVPSPRWLNRRWSLGRWAGELHPAGTPARRRGREQFGAAQRSRSAGRKLVFPTAAEAPEELGVARCSGAAARTCRSGWWPVPCPVRCWDQAIWLRTVRAGGGCLPRCRWILSGGDCVSATGGRCPLPPQLRACEGELASANRWGRCRPRGEWISRGWMVG
jgi:hypothetical protein